MKVSGVATGGVAVVVGLGVLYLAVTGQLDKLDRSVRSGWGAARNSWTGSVILGPSTTPAPPKRPSVAPAGRFAWPLSLS